MDARTGEETSSRVKTHDDFKYIFSLTQFHIYSPSLAKLIKQKY